MVLRSVLIGGGVKTIFKGMVQGEKEELQAALEEAESALEQEENKVFISILSLFS